MINMKKIHSRLWNKFKKSYLELEKKQRNFRHLHELGFIDFCEYFELIRRSLVYFLLKWHKSVMRNAWKYENFVEMNLNLERVSKIVLINCNEEIEL